MDNLYEQVIITKNKPLFKRKICIDNHQIFYKYTSSKYYKYIYELLDTLCKKSPYENKDFIFHMSLYFILKILYKCKNIPYLTNLDLMVLNCFSLGIKTTVKQENFPSITRIKKIYEEKYINYKNEEICEGEIICLKLLNYNINIVTAYEYIIYLTQNDLKLKELSLKNLNFMMINKLKQFIFKSSCDIAQECIRNVKEKIFVKEPKIIKKKIICSSRFNCSPEIKKCSSTDKFVNSISEFTKSDKVNNGDLKIKIKKITNIHKPKFFFANSKKSNNLINNNLNLKNSVDRVYCKKSCNDIHPSSNTSLITDTNLASENNDKKKKLLYSKLNRITDNKYIYTNNNTCIRNYLKIYKKSPDINRKKICLNINKDKIQFNRNNYININCDRSVNLNMKNTQYLKKNIHCYNNNYNISKENDSLYLNLYNKRKDSSNINITDCNNRYSGEDKELQNSCYNSIIQEIQSKIETKNINLGNLRGLNNNINNNSNFQRYNISLRKNDNHEKLSSTNYFSNTNSSQDVNYFSNRSLVNYHTHL